MHQCRAAQNALVPVLGEAAGVLPPLRAAKEGGCRSGLRMTCSMEGGAGVGGWGCIRAAAAADLAALLALRER